MGSGGLHSSDQPALHRSDTEWEIYEADVASYYPSMMARFGIFPRSLGECGLEQFKEVLAERLDVKERAGTATDPAIQKRLKVQAHGLKIVLNSTFGQFGNPYSVLYDPTAFLAVTLTGQLMLIDLLERLDSAGAEILSVNTDGLYFKVRRDEEAWCKTLESWEVDSGMVLETTPVDALVIEATNHYAIMYADGRVKRRGNLSDVVDWKHVPKHQIVSDAVVAALFDGILPETTIRRCVDPAKFVSITRRDSSKVGVLVNDATGAETPLPRLTRWYKAKDSPYRIEHRWRSDDGKEHKSTPPGASGVQLLMDLPDGPLGDIDLGWYVGEARARILANRDFPHLDPKWLDGPSARTCTPSASPQPQLGGEEVAEGCQEGPALLLLGLEPVRRVRHLHRPRRRCLGAGHRRARRSSASGSRLRSGSSGTWAIAWSRTTGRTPPEAVRAGEAKGKLIFRFAADADHPLARVGKAALRAALGSRSSTGMAIQLFSVEHPDGPEQEYLLRWSARPAAGLVDRRPDCAGVRETAQAQSQAKVDQFGRHFAPYYR